MRFLFKLTVFGLMLVPSVMLAQTTEFTYQGKLNDGANAANASYDFDFRLFDVASGGAQVGSTLTRNGVVVSGGVFSVNLDFGSSFPGADRFLEIGIRPAGVGSFTTLSPRQRIASAPYSVKTLNADNAATAGTATNSQQLGGVAADQYVQTTDARLTDPRAPTAGSGNYVQNTTTLQPTSNFNISGTGNAGILTAATEYRLSGERIIGIGSNSLFLGGSAGQNSTASNTLFIGRFAGQDNTGTGNIFIGDRSGRFNTGSDNTFAGSNSGVNNTSGGANSFFGHFAGLTNTTGAFNAFFGEGAGQVNNSNSNSFFGYNAGRFVSTGANNVFVGSSAGAANTTGSNNTLLGQGADLGSSGLMFASAVGSGAVVSANNTVVLGRSADSVQIPGNLQVTGNFTGNLPAGSPNYIQNTTSPQATSNFNISGNGVIAGNVGIGTAVPGFRLDVSAGAGGLGGIRSRSITGPAEVTIDAFNGEANLFFSDAGTARWAIRNNSATDDLELFEASESARIVIKNATGKVGFGTTTPVGRVEIRSPDGGFDDELTVTGIFNVPQVIGRRANGTTGALTAVGNQDDLFVLGGNGYNGSAFTAGDSASIRMQSTQTWTASANGSEIDFFTTPNGSTTAQNRMSVRNNGTVDVVGTLSKGAGSFKIDHPLDPENKYLYHSFVESPDMKNIYDGVVTLDANGVAEVELPDWFGALNDKFRYQLTAIDAPGPNLHIAKKMANNKFSIAGGAPGMEVSWQVTGIRKDAFANKNRIPVEELKSDEERGTYLHPEEFGQSLEKGLFTRKSAGAEGARDANAFKRARAEAASKPAAQTLQSSVVDATNATKPKIRKP